MIVVVVKLVVDMVDVVVNFFFVFMTPLFEKKTGFSPVIYIQTLELSF